MDIENTGESQDTNTSSTDNTAVISDNTQMIPEPEPLTEAQKKEQQKQVLKEKFLEVYSRLQTGCGRHLCRSIACIANPKNRDLLSDPSLKQLRALKILKENLSQLEMCSVLENERHRSIQATDFASETANFKPFLEQVERVFHDFDALSISFWKQPLSQQDWQVEPTNGFFDLPAYTAFIASIASCPQDQQAALHNAIHSGFVSLLSNLTTEESFRKRFIIREDLRVLLIALLYPPTFQDEKKLFQIIAHTICFLQDEEFEMLAHWMKEVSQATFKEIIDNAKTIIMITLLDMETETDKTLEQHATMKVMQILYMSNLLIERVPRDSFLLSIFNQEESESVNPVEEYKSWLYSKSDKRKNNEFSFCNYPFCMDIKFKYLLLEIDSKFAQKNEHEKKIRSLIDQGHMFVNSSELYLIFEVSRDNILQDTLTAISIPSQNYRLPFKVKFRGEQGIDEGGLRKEYYQIMIKQLFNPDFGLFLEKQNKQFFWFNGLSLDMPILYELFGSLMGIAIYNQIQMDVRFPNVIYKKLIGEMVSLEDINQFDSATYKGLKHILEYDGDLENDLQQCFSIEYESFGETFTYELIPGGDSIPVTQENKKQYIDLYVDYILNKSIEKQFNNFKRGFFKVLNKDIIKWFTFDELVLILTGKEDIDLEELKRCAVYESGYTETSQQIVWLWEIVEEFSIEQRKKFVFFCTGSDRAPVTGFSSLRFIIGKNGDNNAQLPSAHTCFNHLLIPEYASKEILKDKLLLSLENSEGFGLY